jgi:uncharacterized membrane protein
MAAFLRILSLHGKELATMFGLSMLPVLELRGGLVYAATAARNVPLWLSFLTCFIGNILPIPFILLALRRVFSFLEHFRLTARLVRGLERRARKHNAQLQKYAAFGLFTLVAIPLPGTGGWTGALVAVVFDMQIRRAFPLIAAGIFAAGGVMLLITYFVPGLFGFSFSLT